MSIAARTPRFALVVAAVGAVLCVIGLFVDPERLAAAYLIAYVSCLAVVLGTLAMIMMARVTAATWFVSLRRQAEEVVATLPDDVRALRLTRESRGGRPRRAIALRGRRLIRLSRRAAR